jgi:small subunit ribosomal protein S5
MERRPKRDFKKDKGDGFETNVLDLSRVTRVTKGGRQMRFRAVVVAGDKKGKIGVGVSKGLDVSQAIEKATTKAKKNVVTIPLVDGTIAYQVETKLGPSRVLLKPQIKGRGLVAGGTIRVICSLVGIEDISSKIMSRTKNKLNNARAVIKALKKLR